MPATTLKPLYLAKNMDELNALIPTKTNFKLKSTSSLVASANKIYQNAETSVLERDEEKAYTYFMRFVDVILILKDRSEFLKNKEYKAIMQQVNPAVVKAEDLKSSLIKRYPKREPDLDVKVKNDINHIMNEVSVNISKPDVVAAAGDSPNNGEVQINKEPELVENAMSSSKLLSLLTTNHSKIIIMDIRPAKDFEESHIKHSNCISIPQEILMPGITASRLENMLPSDSLPQWKLRGEAEYVILIDSDSSNDSKPSGPLNVLKQAITKWDQKCTLRNPPVILRGGYRDWMLKYPMYTTRALNFNLIESDLKGPPTIADISGLDYPNLDENVPEKNGVIKENLNEPGILFKKSHVPPPVISKAPDSTHSRKPKSAPTVDRKSKPVIVNAKPSTATTRQPYKNTTPNKTVSINSLVPEDNDAHSLNRSNSSANYQSGKISPESHGKQTSISGLFVKDESLTSVNLAKEDSFELAKQQLLKEHELEKLRLRKEKEAEEDRRIEIQKQENILIDKYNEKDAEFQKMKEENEKLKKLLEEPGDKNQQKVKEKEELDKLQEEIRKSREERKLKEAKKKLESNPVPRGVASANSGLKRQNVAQNQNNSQNSEYTVPLSRQTSTDGGSRGLVRSHSSPNIAQMINQDESSQRKMPAFDRSLKPPATPTYQSNEISRARLRNLNPVYGNCPATGLRNLGNTCFMNSVIQCLSNTIPLADYFISNQYLEDINRDSRQGMGGEVAEEFAVVIRTLWMGQYKSFSPKDFKNTVSKCLSVCIGNEQQDSHEFLVVLMEKLHADLNKSAVKNVPKLDSCHDENTFWQHHKSYNSSRISNIFEGLLKSTLTCLTCRKTSDSYEVFSCLSLPILASRCSLRDCFQHFLKSEKISGEAAWDCPRCKQKKEAEKRLKICRLPEVLAIQLKRFSYEGLWRRKLQTHVDFDFNFDVPFERNSEESYRRYSLYSIVNHYGTLEGGHYIAFCNANSNKWYKYDDHEVSEISTSDIKTSAAYLLFYQAADLRSNL